VSAQNSTDLSSPSHVGGANAGVLPEAIGFLPFLEHTSRYLPQSNAIFLPSLTLNVA
jgi:hypothetical protein